MSVTTFLILAGLVAATVGVREVAVTVPCDEVAQDKCTIGEVRIDPCKVKKPCTFKKGKVASMEFDFTPYFDAGNLTTGVYWNNPSGIDVPFAGFGSDDACLLTACPTVSGRQQALNYNVHVGKKLPTGSFQFKWKVWNAQNDAEVCCFRTTVVLKK